MFLSCHSLQAVKQKLSMFWIVFRKLLQPRQRSQVAQLQLWQEHTHTRMQILTVELIRIQKWVWLYTILLLPQKFKVLQSFRWYLAFCISPCYDRLLEPSL